MHLQSTHAQHLQHLYPDLHLESGRKSVVELFCENSQRVKAVGCFRIGAPLLMFDRILNATLSDEEVTTTVVTQENLELPPNSLDSHQTQKQDEILE